MGDEEQRPGRLFRKLTMAETAGHKQEREVQAWIRRLVGAEKTAALAKSAKVFLYQVNYRVTKEESELKGSADRRRGSLVRLIEALMPQEKHLSTSTWIVRLHISAAEVVADLLMPPLESFDFLNVAQVSPQNRAKRGDADLD